LGKPRQRGERLQQTDRTDCGNSGDIDEGAIESARSAFKEALDNDLNTSLAVTALYDLLKQKVNGATKLAMIADYDRVLALDLIAHADALKAERAAESVDKEWVEAMIEKRAQAKKDKDYAAADAIRKELLDAGIALMDTKEGVKWSVVK